MPQMFLKLAFAKRLRRAVAPALGLATLATLGSFGTNGCSKEDTTIDTNSTASNTTSGSGGGNTAVCTSPTAVACSDQVILQMNLQAVAAPGLITNTAEGAGFASVVDATAGGAFATTPHSYVYARFGATGLEKVALSDEDALTSMDWDIAFRRYVIRVNSANSGPSCVSAARLPGTPDFDSVTSEPANLTFHEDEYFTPDPDCTLIPDGTGLPGSPATALSSYWTYPGCVSMSHNVFVVELADGRHIKLTVTHYYNDASQTQCDTQNTVPQTGSGAATIRVRWAELP